jgi:hypothetical protein
MPIQHLPAWRHLHVFQREALTAIRDADIAGKRRVIVSLPTATGKTVAVAHFPRVLNMKKSIARARPLRGTAPAGAGTSLDPSTPEFKAEIEQDDAHAAADAKVVIASVPTPARSGDRLLRLKPE